MAERKWTNGSYFGYLYIAFAGLTDNELSDVEKGENCKLRCGMVAPAKR